MEIVIIVGLIFLNGLLSMSEIALVSARKSKLELEAKKDGKSAQKALALMSKPDTFFSTIQIGITLIGILTGLYSGEAFANDLAETVKKVPFFEPYSLLLSKTLIVIIVTYATLILGELVPKRLGMGKAEQIAKIMSRPMSILSVLTSPFVWFLSVSTNFVLGLLGVKAMDDAKVTEEEIKAIVKEGLDDGEVQEVEQDIVERVFNLGDRDIGSIMTHRAELVYLDINDTHEAVKEKVKEHLFNIYPVTSDKFDNVLGVVSLKDLFLKLDSPDFSLQQIMRPAQFLPENLSVYNALEQFKSARVKYSLVTDEFGGIQGIVTLKDIMEALVGQLPEIGEELEIVQREDGSWLVDGQFSFYDFLDYFGMEDLYAEHDYNTLAGLILELLERVPRTGEKLTWLNFEFEIIDMDGVRIDKVLVNKNYNGKN